MSTAEPAIRSMTRRRVGVSVVTALGIAGVGLLGCRAVVGSARASIDAVFIDATCRSERSEDSGAFALRRVAATEPVLCATRVRTP